MRETGRPVDPEHLRMIEVFQELDDPSLQRLARLGEVLEVEVDQIIVEEDMPSRALHLILEGAVAVFREIASGEAQIMNELSQGDIFGELGVFAVDRRLASVRAAQKSLIWRIQKERLMDFLQDFPELERRMQLHAANAAVNLELGRRREVRIRVQQKVRVRFEDQESREATLVNLSPGGICLYGVPDEWKVKKPIVFTLDLDSGPLHLAGFVAWRQKKFGGVQFQKTIKNHDALIQMTIRSMLESHPA